MATARKAPSAFRRWLVEKLKATRWAHPVSGMSLEAAAEHLWVHPDALRAAQDSLKRDMAEYGRATSGLNAGTPMRAKQFAIGVPAEVLKVLRDYARLRALTVDTLLRSVVHDILLSPTLPEVRSGTGWFVWGQRFQIPHTRPLLAKTRLTYGAHRALVRRAQFAGLNASSLVRAVLIDILEGRKSEFQIITGPGAMWDDETRYFIPPVAQRSDP